MNDTVVSVRLPKNLLAELKELATKNNYLDLSELVRDILREKSIEKIKQYDPAPPHKKQTKDSVDKEKLIDELLKIIEDLKDEK